MNLSLNQTHPTNRLRRLDIQVLRGISILSVLLFHAWPNSFPLGFLGVDAFFVISGVVMTPIIIRIITADDSSSMWRKLFEFYKFRFFRLAPAFAASLILATILVFLFGNLRDHIRVAMQGIYSMFILGNIGASRWSGNYFNAEQNPLVHLWSLSVEEQFYFFIPLATVFLIIVSTKIGNRKSNHTRLFTFFISTLFLISLTLFLSKDVNYYLSSINIFGFKFAFSETFSFYAPWQRIWEFAIGSFTVILMRNRPRINEKLAIFFLFLLVFLIFSGYKSIDHRIAVLLVCILTACIIFFECKFKRFLKMTFLFEKLGDYSYSIYLVHLPIIYIFSDGFFSRLAFPKNLGIFMASCLSIILGAVIYFGIEKPLKMNKISGVGMKVKTRAYISFGLIASAASLLVAMDVGSNNRYWGLDKNIKLPLSAGFLDRRDCALDTAFGDPCIFVENPNKGLVYLIGDSHAAQLSKVVKDVALENGLNVAIGTHSGYPIVIHSKVPGKKYNTSLAYANTQASLDWIKKHKPSLVIISEYYASWEKSEMERAMLEIKALVPRLLIVNQTPAFTDSAYMKFLSLFEKPYNPPKKMKITSISRESINANKYFNNWGKSNGISVLDPWKIFCDSYYCNRFEGGQWLYSDVHHLTISGADKLHSSLTAAVLEVAKTN